jgi:hypothetical protein
MALIEVILGSWEDDTGAKDNVLRYRGGLFSAAVVSCNVVRGDAVGGAEDVDILGEARSRTMRLFLASDDVALTLRSLLDGLGTERVKSFCAASLALAIDCRPTTADCTHIVGVGKALSLR